jgi:septum site-determining protein MinD
MRIIDICSGKGGVGKTTIAANLGMALHMQNQRVVVVDCNLTTSHLGLSLGFYPEKTFNNFLRKEARLEDVIYTHHSGLRIVPASLELNSLSNIETENLKAEIRKAFQDYNFVLLDSAPGIGRESLIALAACDEAIFVANPYIQSAVDVLKTKQLSDKLGFRNTGIILNRVRKKGYELGPMDMMNFSELPVIASIPEDESVLKCTNSRQLPVLAYPKCRASRALVQLARGISMPWTFQYNAKKFF